MMETDASMIVVALTPCVHLSKHPNCMPKICALTPSEIITLKKNHFYEKKKK